MTSNDLLQEMLRVTREGLGGEIRPLTGQIQQLTGVSADQLLGLRANTDALTQNTAGMASRVEKATQSLGGGMFLSPLLGGILRLFGGGKAPASPPPLRPYERAEPVRLDLGMGSAAAAGTAPATAEEQTMRTRSAAPAAQPVTVNVQAFDSRSFLDHSEEIALALRRAMLSSQAVRDVMSE